MLRDSKTSVSVIALLASLFSAPVCAQTVTAAADGQDAQTGSVESVVVTGSRVISDVANSPTPMTAVSSRISCWTTTPSNLADGLEQAAGFPEQRVEP